MKLLSWNQFKFGVVGFRDPNEWRGLYFGLVGEELGVGVVLRVGMTWSSGSDRKAL